MKFIATVKIPAGKGGEKVRGRCPLTSMKTCTDVNGRHHSFAMVADNEKQAQDMVKIWGEASGFTLTRLERYE